MARGANLLRSVGTMALLSGLVLALPWTVPAPVAAAEEDPLVLAVSRSNGVLGRLQRDHRISMATEPFGHERAVHVYTTLSDFDAPFSMSLGWFTGGGVKGDGRCLDEFGEKIPLPGQKPDRAGFNKADLHVIRGFDFVSDGNLKAALSEFAAAVKAAPQSAKAHNNLGACAAALGQYGLAQTELGLAFKIKEDYALTLANNAWLALSLNQPKLAVSDAKEALKLHPDLKPAVLAMVKAYLDLKEPAEALGIANRAFVSWSEDPQVAVLAGDASLDGGDVKGATRRYQKALLYGPNNPKVLRRLAEVAERSGDLDEALRRARSASMAAPKDAEAHLILGRYLEMNRDSRAAQIQYELALDLAPTFTIRLSVFGPLLRVLMNTNKLTDAEKLSREWLKRNPESPDCHYNRAWVTSQLPGPAMKAEAVAEYRKAVALNPRLVQAHFNLGILLANQGRSGEAVSELRDFIEKAPTDPDVASAREMLTKLGQ